MDDFSPASIFSRFRRTLLTHQQADADRFFQKVSELVPVVVDEFGDDLMEYEIFLLAGVLNNLREIEELKATVEIISVALPSTGTWQAGTDRDRRR